jgi:hypothetical protein
MTKYLLSVLCLIPYFSFAQLTDLPQGGNKRASVSEDVGITHVTITYNRPRVKGRDGKIWGTLIPVGYTDQGFGTSKAAPWRAGANENTTIEFSTDVMIEGQPLPAGKYGFFIAYDPNESTLIFSKNSTSWGSFYYNPDEDALRVKVKPQNLDQKVEWLKYEFMNQTDTTAVVGLQWEKLMIPFTISTDYTNIQLTSIRNQLRSGLNGYWEVWNAAADWCVRHHTNLEEGLLWADSATSDNFGGGGRSYAALVTKSELLEDLGRTNEAKATMQKALPYGSMIDVHIYARQLLAAGKKKEALAAFTLNYNKYPGQFMTLVGMARGNSAVGDYKTALKYAQQAEPLVDQLNKGPLEIMIDKLKNGQDIN